MKGGRWEGDYQLDLEYAGIHSGPVRAGVEYDCCTTAGWSS